MAEYDSCTGIMPARRTDSGVSGAGMSDQRGSARIVQLTPGPPGAPAPCFVLIPGTGGRIDGFVNLAPNLQVPMRVFTIEGRGFDQASRPDSNVPEMAEHYLALIKTVQAAGPYFLLGHSFGGLVALEVAQILVAAREEVACLIMLDTPTPEKCWPVGFYLKSRVSKVRRQLNTILGASLAGNLTAYRRNASLRSTDVDKMPADIMIGTNVARVLLAHSVARETYNPQFYPHKVTFFRPLEQAAGYEALWRNRVGEIEVFSASGNHLSMIEPPHAPLLAAQLSACVTKCVGALPIGATAAGSATEHPKPWACEKA